MGLSETFISVIIGISMHEKATSEWVSWIA